MTDEDKMPFGKHKGKRMADVPADYLLWLWDNGVHQEPGKPVHGYIKENFKQLEKLAKDYIPDISNRPYR